MSIEAIWMCETEQAFWFEREEPQGLSGDVTVTKMVPAQQRKPQFKEFIKWAGAAGYDTAQTYNTDKNMWICLNPMTADLWKSWQAAHGIEVQP